jgi:hypothetical protein
VLEAVQQVQLAIWPPADARAYLKSAIAKPVQPVTHKDALLALFELDHVVSHTLTEKQGVPVLGEAVAFVVEVGLWKVACHE